MLPHSLNQKLNIFLSTTNSCEKSFIQHLKLLPSSNPNPSPSLRNFKLSPSFPSLKPLNQSDKSKTTTLIHKFWERLEVIYRKSLEKIEGLGISTPRMREYYEEICGMIKMFREEVRGFDEIGRVEYLVGKKMYYGVMGRYVQDLKIVQELESGIKEGCEKRKKGKGKEKRLEKVKSANWRSNLHLKGLETYFDLRKSYRSIKLKGKSLEFAFDELQTRNLSIKKTITQTSNPQKYPSEYYPSMISKPLNSFSPGNYSSKTSPRSPLFSPSFGKSFPSIKYKLLFPSPRQ